MTFLEVLSFRMAIVWIGIKRQTVSGCYEEKKESREKLRGQNFVTNA